MLCTHHVDFHSHPAAPHAPTLAAVAKLNELQLNCSFGDDIIYCNVTMEINGMVMSASMNGTFYGLVSNTLYPISARAINRCGNYSETSTSYWTCKAIKGILHGLTIPVQSIAIIS